MDMKLDIIEYSPLEIFVPERLDLIVKYMYIKSKIEGINRDLYTNLYIKHITKRTAGKQFVFEYIDGYPVPTAKKLGIKDYLVHFDKLIDSFYSSGFQRDFFIPISKVNGILLDGAHRAACAAYFNKSPFIVIENRIGKNWDYTWFEVNGFYENELNLILSTYIKLKKDKLFFFVLWAPVIDYWTDIEMEITEKLKIVFTRDYDFSSNNFAEVVNDLYSYEFGLSLPKKIQKKIEALSSFKPVFRILLVEVGKPTYTRSLGKDMCVEVVDIKSKIRGKYDHVVRHKDYITIHSSDNSDHTGYMESFLISSNNILNLKRRKVDSYREEFLLWLEEYSEVLKSYGILTNECCIVGSGPMEVLGIRDATDIDFVMDNKKRMKLFDEKSRALSDNIDLVHLGYHEYNNSDNPIPDDEIINNPNYHFYFRGFKFANIELVRDRKYNHRRTKDVLDVNLIDGFFD